MFVKEEAVVPALLWQDHLISWPLRMRNARPGTCGSEGNDYSKARAPSKCPQMPRSLWTQGEEHARASDHLAMCGGTSNHIASGSGWLPPYSLSWVTDLSQGAALAWAPFHFDWLSVLFRPFLTRSFNGEGFRLPVELPAASWCTSSNVDTLQKGEMSNRLPEP